VLVAASHVGFVVRAVRSGAYRGGGARKRSHFGRNFFATTMSISARMLEFTMNSIAIVHPRARGRWALIAASIFALLGSFAATAHAQAGYYGGYGYNPCSYRCGYPAYHYYPRYRHHYGCYSCGRHLIYERRYVEREYVERRYGYGGYRRYDSGYYPDYRRHYGYYPYGGYRRPWGYGYGAIGRRWSVPYVEGYEAPYGEGYEAPPRPPAPVWEGRDD
jgi:hypothetical protein